MQLTECNSHLIGVVSDEFTNPYSVKMLNEVTRQLNQRGYCTLLLNVDSRQRYPVLLQMAAQLQVEGLVFLASVSTDELAVAAEILPHVPTIHLCRSDSAGAQVVSVDDYAAGVETGHLLLAQGYQRFGYLQGKDSAAAHPLRREGYAASLAAADKALDQLLVAGNDDRQLAYQAMMSYLKQARMSDRIDALFCENDVLAFGAMQAIQDMNEAVHIGVVGFDDVDEARSSTWHLTSWAPRGDLLVSEALNRLLDKRADENGAWRQGELQIRHSHLTKHVHGEMTKCGCASRH